MFETTFSVEKQNQHLANYIVNAVSQGMAEIDGIVTTLESKNRVYVSLACGDAYRYCVKRLADKTATEVLVCGYKNVFIHKMLGVGYGNFYVDTLVNAVCALDCGTDKQEVQKMLGDSTSLFLDGYYNFRMQKLKNKWAELAGLICSGGVLLEDSELIVEFLAYLSETVAGSAKEISVTFDNGFTLYSADNKVIVPFLPLEKQPSDEKNAMVNLICIKPDKLKIYGETSAEFTAMAKSLFNVEKVVVN